MFSLLAGRQIGESLGARRTSKGEETITVNSRETRKSFVQLLATHALDGVAPEAIHLSDDAHVLISFLDTGGLCHGFRLQINSVNLVALGCHHQRSIANVQRLDKNPLNVLLERWVNPIREYCQIPKLFVGLSIPSLNVCATTIVVGSDVSNALINYRLDLCWCDALGEHQTWQEQRHRDKNEN